MKFSPTAGVLADYSDELGIRRLMMLCMAQIHGKPHFPVQVALCVVKALESTIPGLPD